MGPSGAGKSTFLDALCKRAPSATGTVSFSRPRRAQCDELTTSSFPSSPTAPQVLLNGSSDFSTRDIFSFVEQDDALLGVLTVRESVLFAARLS